MNRFVTRDDVRLVERDARHASRRRTGRDDDLARLKRARLSAGHLNASLAGETRGAFDPFDLVLLEQKFDALGEARDDLVLARMDARHVDDGCDVFAAEADAPLRGVLRHL